LKMPVGEAGGFFLRNRSTIEAVAEGDRHTIDVQRAVWR
jgi:hypothetical protein